jgi:hypothetical protein
VPLDTGAVLELALAAALATVDGLLDGVDGSSADGEPFLLAVMASPPEEGAGSWDVQAQTSIEAAKAMTK